MLLLIVSQSATTGLSIVHSVMSLLRLVQRYPKLYREIISIESGDDRYSGTVEQTNNNFTAKKK